MSIPPTTGAPATTPDPMDLTSGTPEPASQNLGSPGVEITGINCTVISYPRLGDGGIANSFKNTSG